MDVSSSSTLSQPERESHLVLPTHRRHPRQRVQLVAQHRDVGGRLHTPVYARARHRRHVRITHAKYFSGLFRHVHTAQSVGTPHVIPREPVRLCVFTGQFAERHDVCRYIHRGDWTPELVLKERHDRITLQRVHDEVVEQRPGHRAQRRLRPRDDRAPQRDVSPGGVVLLDVNLRAQFAPAVRVHRGRRVDVLDAVGRLPIIHLVRRQVHQKWSDGPAVVIHQ